MAGSIRAWRRRLERGGGAAGTAADARALARRAGAAAGAVVLATLVASAIFAPLIVPYDWNATSVCRRLAAPSAAHWFGCDLFGRDILSRVLVGARYSLAMGISTVAIGLMFGSLIGMAIAYAGGRGMRWARG